VELNMRLTEAAYRETMAEDMRGFLTRAAHSAKNGVSLVLTPLSFLNPVTTLTLGCLGAITFQLALIPFNIIWIAMLGWLLGTSWLWLKAPILRPVLFLPGVVTAPLCGVYAGWMPSYGELDARLARVNAAGGGYLAATSASSGTTTVTFPLMSSRTSYT
jgi:hypothetical protein